MRDAKRLQLSRSGMGGRRLKIIDPDMQTILPSDSQHARYDENPVGRVTACGKRYKHEPETRSMYD